MSEVGIIHRSDGPHLPRMQRRLQQPTTRLNVSIANRISAEPASALGMKIEPGVPEMGDEVVKFRRHLLNDDGTGLPGMSLQMVGDR